jgi:signal transduction histidine kinase
MLLLGANAALIALPLLALFGLRVYDAYLLRQTERQLLAESAVIAEAFREAWRKERGITQDEHRPPGHGAEPYAPIEPLIDIGVTVLPAQSSEDVTPPATPADPATVRAGAALEPLLRRAQTFNLSAVRVLDARGCVVATTRSEEGQCMPRLPEVQRALSGRYAAVARERVSDEPAPPLGDIRRRGSVRVFTALPVFSDGRVIAVVRASRTGLDAMSSLWANRRGLVVGALALGMLVLAVSLLFSAAIARPLRRLTQSARAIAQGEPAASPVAPGFAPAEVALLSSVLEQMTERLRARAEYVSEFAAQASHELKTPITAIRGAAELLQQGWQDMDAAQRQRFLDNVVADAERMEQLVRRLLELAQIENAPAERGESLSPADLASRVLARHGDAVQLELRAPPALIAISEAHLYSVLANLVDNALRHGAGQPVHVTLAGEHGRLRIDVRDRGPGISEANQRRLFTRFFTTERDRGGTGLGLAIVKAIVDARGGSVAVESGPGGTVFTVVL